MATFSEIQPSSLGYTPPQLASGSSKFWMAMLGKKADGTSNTFGDIAGFFPGVGIAQHMAAQRVANGTGLREVSQNVSDGLDTKMAQLQTSLGAVKTVAGALTLNPGLVSSGVGETLGGLGAYMGSNTADEQAIIDNNKNRTKYVPAYYKGGIMDKATTLYSPEDTTEDLVVLDKKTGEKIAEMRKGEGVFSQMATLNIQKLVARGDVSGLGKLIISEVKDNPMWQDKVVGEVAFAGGGKMPVKKVTPKPVAKAAPSFTIGDPSLDTALTDSMVTKTKPNNSITDGAANRLFDTSKLAPGLPDLWQTILPEGMSADKATAGDGATKSASSDYMGMIFDGLKAGVSALGAATPLPVRTDNPELARMQEQYRLNAQEGLSAADKIGYLRQQRAGYQRDIENISNTMGGGGSAAAVLSAQGAASSRADGIAMQVSQLDRQTRMQNQDRYQSVLNQEDARNRADYGMLYNNAVTSRDAYGKSMVANLQQLSDRQQYGTSGYGAFLSQLQNDALAKSKSLTALSGVATPK